MEWFKFDSWKLTLVSDVVGAISVVGSVCTGGTVVLAVEAVRETDVVPRVVVFALTVAVESFETVAIVVVFELEVETKTVELDDDVSSTAWVVVGAKVEVNGTVMGSRIWRRI